MPKILPIIKGADNKILRSKSKKINLDNIAAEELAEFIENIKATMRHSGGIGLAAPQVGKNIRLFMVETGQGAQVFINPVIIWRSAIKEIDEEGCLSLPGLWGEVKRSKNIVVKFLDELGNNKILKAPGFMARVIQHEYDHLNGVLFIDQAKNIKKKT